MDVSKALAEVTSHVNKHSDNKYQHSILDTERALVRPEFTLLTANKYIARYLAKSGEKNANPEDLKKAIHFLLFELQARLNSQAAVEVPVVASLVNKETWNRPRTSCSFELTGDELISVHTSDRPEGPNTITHFIVNRGGSKVNSDELANFELESIRNSLNMTTDLKLVEFINKTLNYRRQQSRH